MIYNNFEGANLKRLKQVNSYSKITDTVQINDSVILRMLTSWNIHHYPNRFRVFLFKFYNNILGTGNRLAHFENNVNVECVFCSQNQLLPAPIESFTHVFYDCPFVNKIIEKFYFKYFTIELDRVPFFSGDFGYKKDDYLIVGTVLDSLRYSIWQM